MISFRNTIQIDRPVGEVYAYLSDFEHIPEWNWAITETRRLTPGPIAVGSRYQQTRSTPQRATESFEITTLTPRQRIEIRGSLAGLPARLAYDFRETETGTELTNTVNLEPHGALRLASPVLATRVRRAVAANLSELRVQLETSTNAYEAEQS